MNAAPISGFLSYPRLPAADMVGGSRITVGLDDKNSGTILADRQNYPS
jgi:hypothetical protein